jgi:deoxyribonuclease-4
MPHFGAHMSIAGGPTRALDEAAELGCTALQVFTRAPSQWASKPIDAETARAFREALAASAVRVAAAHDSYLINLASPDEELYRRSIEAFVDEMHRAEALGLHYLVMHPGAHLDGTEEEGLARVALALDEVHRRCKGQAVRVLIETTAGQGTTLGHRFEHLGRILSLVKDADRLGVCLDTCHVFAAGYGLWPKAEYEATMRHLSRVVGLERVRLFHVNDSKKGKGSRVDRHAHIGKGEIGLGAFRLLVSDRRFHDRGMVLETPKEEGDVQMDPVNLAVLRELLAEAKSARPA